MPGRPRRRVKVLRPGRQLAFASRILLPRGGSELVRDFLHRDTVFDRADLAAQVAADTGFVNDLDNRRSIVPLVPPNRLVCAVLARGPAQLAADALVVVDARDQVIVEIELFPLRDVRYGAPTKVIDAPVSTLVHPVTEAVGEILDDSEAVMHRCGAHLYRACAERDELSGIGPGGDPANARHRDRDTRVSRDRGQQV